MTTAIQSDAATESAIAARTRLQIDAEQAEAGLSPQTLEGHKNPVSPRDSMMEQIAAQRLRERGVDPVDTNTPEPEPVKAAVPKEEPTEQAEQIASQLEADDKPTVLDSTKFSKFTVKTKVDGKEVETSLDDVIRRFQKNEAADDRLRQANEILERAKSLQPEAKKPEPAPPKAEPSEAKKKLLDALYSGDEETASAALDEVLASVSGRQEPIQPDQIAAQAAQRVRSELDIEGALNAFQKANPKLWDDPYLSQFVANRAQALMEEGKSFADALNDAGKEANDWVARITGAATGTAATTTSAVTDRQALKQQAAAHQVTGVSAKATLSEPKPPSRAEVLAEMAAARGQRYVGSGT